MNSKKKTVWELAEKASKEIESWPKWKKEAAEDLAKPIDLKNAMKCRCEVL